MPPFTESLSDTGPGGIDITTWMSEGFEEEPLATTTAGRTTLGEAVASHPLRDTVEAHEAVHRQQHQRFEQGAPAASREALEAEAQRGSEALEANRPFEAALGAPPDLTLAFTPILGGLLGGCRREPSTDAEADLAFLDDGTRGEDAPPLVSFGTDGTVREEDRQIVQLAFDAAYRVATSPESGARLDTLRAKFLADGVPGAENLTQARHVAALEGLHVNLADTAQRPDVKEALQNEEGTVPTAGFTPPDSHDIYLRQFAIDEGREALAGLLFHEALHVAGLPDEPMNGSFRDYMESWMHDAEADLGFPFSAIAEERVSLTGVTAFGDGLAFRVSVSAPEELGDQSEVQVLDGNRDVVHSETRPASFRGLLEWDGKAKNGERTASGLHSVRVLCDGAMYASQDIVLRRGWS